MYPQSPFSSPAPADANGRPGRPAARHARLARLGCTGVLIGALGLGAVACGGSSSPGASGGSGSPAASAAAGGSTRASALETRIYQYLNGLPATKKTAFVQCMRKNGEPSFPSTLTLGALQSAGITLRSAAFRGAFTSCKPTLAK